MKNVTNFRGVMMREDLPEKIGENESGIINLDDSDGKGTHWVCYYNSQDSPYVEYFDSYGLPPPKEVETYLRTSGKKICSNSSQLQMFGSEACGFFCCYYILERNNGKSQYKTVYSLDQMPTFENEQAMKDYFSKHGGTFNWNDFISKFSFNNIHNQFPNLPEMHLVDQGSDGNIRRSSFCGPFSKLDKRLSNFNRETGTYDSIITPPINQLDSGCLQHDIAYVKNKDVPTRNLADQDLIDVANSVISNPNSTWIQKTNAKLVRRIMQYKIDHQV